MKPLIVGEVNPYGPGFALYPHPDGSAGHNLCCRVLGMRREDYLESFARTNLCEGAWCEAAAKIAAGCLLAGRVVALGVRVAAAFGLPKTPFLTHPRRLIPPQLVLVLPHPSGLCRVWNDPAAVGAARDAVRVLCPEIAHLVGVADADRA